jgi:hypothetical protein
MSRNIIFVIILIIIGFEFIYSYETGATLNYYTNSPKIIRRSPQMVVKGRELRLDLSHCCSEPCVEQLHWSCPRIVK